MNKRLVLPGGILWIVGLVLSIVGMNIKTDTGSLIAIIGNCTDQTHPIWATQ